MPTPDAWRKWIRETLGRLKRVEPIVSDDVAREMPLGVRTVLAWQGDPEIKVRCNASGEVRLEAISISAFQGIDLPRKWDDPDRPEDEAPDEQLARMFQRLKPALHAWGEALDHLTRAAPKGRR
jgi:hypothetical protein